MQKVQTPDRRAIDDQSIPVAKIFSVKKDEQRQAAVLNRIKEHLESKEEAVR